MNINKPAGPRSKSVSVRPTPVLDIPFLRPPSNPTTQPHHGTSSILGLERSTSPPAVSPSEPPRFISPVPILPAPIPPRKKPELRIANVYPIIKVKPSSSTDDLSTSSGTIIGNKAVSDSNVPYSGSTIRAPSPSRSRHMAAIPPDAQAQGHEQHRKTESNVNGIRNLIDKLAVIDVPRSTEANKNVPESSATQNVNGGLHNQVPIPQNGSTGNTNTRRKSSPTPSPMASHPIAIRKDFSDEFLEILSRLGEGAGGAVHKVTDKRDGTIYARKIITTRDSSSIRQVLREITIAFGMRHKNIVSSYGAYMSPSSSEVKIVMEYCEGGSLESVGAKLREMGAVIGETTAGRIAEGIFQGLAYLHANNTIHRDIKPSNILLSREGVVKLCDFGVSRQLVHTNVGTFTGTLLYMAPERISGGEYNVRSDIWSAGISLLELVQNRFPFPSDLPPMEVILLIRTGESPKLEDDPVSSIVWSTAMKDFIRLALIHNATERPTTKELLEHPWIKRGLQQEVNMARWMGQVWGWKRKGRRSTSDRLNGSQQQPSSVGDR